MNIAAEKKLIKDQIDSINDESLIHAIKKLLGIMPSLPVLTKEELIKRTLESEKDILAGNVISLEDLEEEMKSW